LRLILDEDMNRNIAYELRRRGYRDATSASHLGLAGRGVKDPVWLYIIARSQTPSVLVTYDNKMCRVHRAAILRRGSTLAVIDNRADRRGRTREEYAREVIHRWAHRMADQTPGTRFLYRLSGRRRIVV
jgi:hypothetical protein